MCKGRHAGGPQSPGSKSVLTALGWPIRFRRSGCDRPHATL